MITLIKIWYNMEVNIEMQRSCEGKLFEDMLVELIHMILRFSMDQTLTFTACLL